MGGGDRDGPHRNPCCGELPEIYPAVPAAAERAFAPMRCRFDESWVAQAPRRRTVEKEAVARLIESVRLTRTDVSRHTGRASGWDGGVGVEVEDLI